MDLLFLFLPGIVLLGIAASFTDISNNKIKNKFIVFAAIYSILAYMLSFMVLKEDTLDLIQISTNTILSLCFGFILYLAKLWGAGDAKLFFAFSMIIPLTSYSNYYIPYFPSVILLTNIFVVSSIYLILISPIVLLKKRFLAKKINKKKIFKDIIIFFLSLLTFSWLANKLFLSLNLQIPPLLIYFLTFFVISGISSKIKKSKYIYIFLILTLTFRTILDLKSLTDPTYYLNLISYSAAFSLLRNIFLKWHSQNSISLVEIRNLKPNMQLAKTYSLDKMKIVLGTKLTNSTILKFCKTYPENKQNQKKIMVKSTLPLAPFMFAAVLITILIKGEVINWIRTMFFP